MGKVARGAERGAAKNSRMPRVIPPQLRLRSAERWLEYGRLAALPLAILPIPPDSPLAASPTGRARLESPVSRWRLLVQYKLGVQCRTPSRSDRFNGVTGGAGGPKGRNRNLPWPPCKKVIKTKKSPLRSSGHYLLIFISSRSRCSCRGRTGPRRGHSPRAGSCCRNSRGNSSRSSSRSRGRSPWGRCWSGTW